jgi:brefeldin A-inhibited guanine nucleotide-exchange protein
MEKFAERFTTQNPDVFPTADAAFILAFSIIMLNTDLHNPAIKEERRMTKEGFLRNNSGICDGKDLPAEVLNSIFDRIKMDPISLKEDDDLRDKESESKGGNALKSPNAGIFTNNFSEMDRKRESDYQKERDQILRNTESLFRRKKKKGTGSSGSSKDLGHFVSTQNSGLKDEYVIPMFDVTWGPALAVFSTVIESANGTMGALLSIATDKEIEAAAENAAAATEVCLSGFRLAIRIAALCGNDTARSAYVHALSNFSLLGTGRLLEHRHIRCVQTLLEVARDDGELLGDSWEYVFKALSEVARLNQVYEATAKATRAEAEAYERKLNRLKALEAKRARQTLRNGGNQELSDDESTDYNSDDYLDSFEEDDFELEDEMDKKAIDETNARIINEYIPEDLSDMIYMRSGGLPAPAMKDFIFQLCRVSRMEIAGYGGHVGNKANDVDLTTVHYRKQHTLLTNVGKDSAGRYNQPDIYSLQKIVEVTHYNMDSRPRLIFADIWNIVSSHLTSTALHENAAVAVYAVDSFRQLSIQFLQREELGVFEFQRKFLRPFEVVMSQCPNSSVKEFLLKAIEQIILMFESDETGNASTQGPEKKRSTSIRSGWRPILAVIGLASRDDDDAIADLGFTMLTTQLRQSLHIKKLADKETSFSASAALRADKFVDLIDALLMYTSGPREDKSSVSIDHLVTIGRYLADESIPLPRHSKTTFSTDESNGPDATKSPIASGKENSEELELWWPLLLGLSKSVGDVRPNIRIKGLVTLLAIINQHFFPSSTKKKSSVLGDIQTLQLIFKGILTPALEHAETNASISSSKISLPDGFIRFMTRGTPTPEVARKGGRKSRIEGADVAIGNNWIDTTFDHLMDGSISLALKSVEVYKDDILIEEVLAMFNTCLISDCAVLVIRGMKRLHHFVTSDLVLEVVTENTWATVSHMLRRCLSVRGLSFDQEFDVQLTEEKERQAIGEFLKEEEIFPSRRYIGSNAAMIIGTILYDKLVVERMGVRWYMFLISGLGAGIKAWDRAAEVFDSYPPKSSSTTNEATP